MCTQCASAYHLLDRGVNGELRDDASLELLQGGGVRAAHRLLEEAVHEAVVLNDHVDSVVGAHGVQ